MRQYDSAELASFQQTVQQYYVMAKRDMPWRSDVRPYYILVSEIMLQQTGVERVKPKFNSFIGQFATINDLANAPLSDVISAWVGLGYNRRARFLHSAARMVHDVYGGELPQNGKQLQTLPGIGSNTAGAILAYAFNQPAIFVETNIRTVYIYHFFSDENEKVDDADIVQLLKQTIDIEHPREWYWALMDYGSYLKKQHGNNIAKSRHYKKQSVFKGSLRQMRGEVIRKLKKDPWPIEILLGELSKDERGPLAISGLKQDGLIEEVNGILYLAGSASASAKKDY